VIRIATILFLSLYILAATEFRQFLKFPVLVEHFNEHKKDNQQISFLDFIYMHYAGDDDNDRDNDRDMQLPFKAQDGSSANILFMPSTSEYSLPEKACTIDSPGINYEELNLTSSYLASIWQPPKAC
jgi:hypothetical protein